MVPCGKGGGGELGWAPLFCFRSSSEASCAETVLMIFSSQRWGAPMRWLCWVWTAVTHDARRCGWWMVGGKVVDGSHGAFGWWLSGPDEVGLDLADGGWEGWGGWSMGAQAQ